MQQGGDVSCLSDCSLWSPGKVQHSRRSCCLHVPLAAAAGGSAPERQSCGLLQQHIHREDWTEQHRCSAGCLLLLHLTRITHNAACLHGHPASSFCLHQVCILSSLTEQEPWGNSAMCCPCCWAPGRKSRRPRRSACSRRLSSSRTRPRQAPSRRRRCLSRAPCLCHLSS